MSNTPTLAESTVPVQSNGSAARPVCPGAEVMPLALTPFERYMLVDDREGYPMTYAHIVELHGEMDRAAMESAVRTTLQRHPLTCAQVEKVGAQFVWVAGSLPESAIHWHDTPPVRLPFAGGRVDLFRQHGFRIDGYTAEGKSVLMFSTHHAITDGLGMIQIIGDVLAFYGIQTASSEKQPKPPQYDPQRLISRGEYQIQLPHPISRWTATKGLMAETWKLVSRRPERIVTHRSTDTDAIGNSGYVCVSIEEEQITAARKQATSAGAGLNQALIRDLFLAMKQWQEEKDNRQGNWLRITMPTSLRSRDDRRTPAANILGYIMLTRHRSECEDQQQLLSGIVSELDFADKWAMGTMFSSSVGMVDRVPGLLHWLSRRSQRFSTVVLSNLGDVTRRFRAKFPRREGRVVAGNLELVNVTAAPPVRPGTSIALAVIGCGGKLNVCAQFDPASISADAVREFLTSYVDRVTQPTGTDEEAVAQ